MSPPGGFLGSRLRELRAARHMSQTALAGAMTRRGFRWYQQTVHRIEHGRQEPAFAEVAALADIFGVQVTSFQPPEGLTA